LLGAFAYVAMPAGGWLRRSVLSAFFAVVLGALFFGYSDMLGRPKAAQIEMFRGGVKGRSSHRLLCPRRRGHLLWLLLPNDSEPRYYKLRGARRPRRRCRTPSRRTPSNMVEAWS